MGIEETWRRGQWWAKMSSHFCPLPPFLFESRDQKRQRDGGWMELGTPPPCVAWGNHLGWPHRWAASVTQQQNGQTQSGLVMTQSGACVTTCEALLRSHAFSFSTHQYACSNWGSDEVLFWNYLDRVFFSSYLATESVFVVFIIFTLRAIGWGHLPDENLFLVERKGIFVFTF